MKKKKKTSFKIKLNYNTNSVAKIVYVNCIVFPKCVRVCGFNCSNLIQTPDMQNNRPYN